MSAILAILILSLRNAIRSRVVVILLVALATTLIGLPLTLKGDGTLAGEARMLLRYTLGLATFILSLATVWAACAAVASDLRARHIQLIASKPVHPWQLWFGKWLGVVTLSTALLLICLATTAIAYRYTLHSRGTTPATTTQIQQELLSAYRALPPQPRDLDAAIEAAYTAGQARGEWPADADPATIRPQLERTLRAQANAVPGGATNTWTFTLPVNRPADAPLLLRYRFNLSTLSMAELHGTWTLTTPDNVTRWTQTVADTPRTGHQLAIPADALPADIRTLRLTFTNHDADAPTALFDPTDGLALRVYSSGFLTNYGKAGLLLFLHIAFLAAIGVTAGAFFSMPVAALTSFYALLLLYASHAINQIISGGAGRLPANAPTATRLVDSIEALAALIYGGLFNVLRPIHTLAPLQRLAEADAITWTEVGAASFHHLILYVGALALLGAWHLRRKEVALPQ
jgi:hypothetical protein